jgi:hypothetical protein
VKSSAHLLQIFQRNAASNVVELVTNFKLLVEQSSIRTQETAHQVALAQMKRLKEKVRLNMILKIYEVWSDNSGTEFITGKSNMR